MPSMDPNASKPLSVEQQVIRDIRRNYGVDEDLLLRASEDQELHETIKNLKAGYNRTLDMSASVSHRSLSWR